METFIQVTTDGIQIVIPWAWRGPFILALIFGATVLAARLIPPVGRFFAALGLPETTRAELRLDTLPKPLSRLLVAFWAALFIVLFLGILWDLAKLALDVAGGPDLTHDTSQGATDARADHRWTLLTLTALTAAISAVIALPFTIIRIGHSRRQTRTAEENLTTDLINKAVEGLGAEKSRKRLMQRKNGDTYELETTEPNLEIRIGAIYQLERIARIQAHLSTKQGAADHIRIMKILCAYVRENSHAEPPKDLGLKPWPKYPRKAGLDLLESRANWRATRSMALQQRVAALPKLRSDIQTALAVLGARDDTQFQIERADKRPGQEDGYRLDLRGANLQAAVLAHLDFRHALFCNARMEGVDLSKSRIDRADFSEAFLSGGHLQGAHLRRAEFTDARMEGVDLCDLQMHSANLRRAQLQGAIFIKSRMKRTILLGTQMEGAILIQTHMQGASANLAQLQGAILSNAQMEGINLRRADLRRAHWHGVTNSAAPAQFADLRGGVDLDQSRLLSMIGNAATLLPETPDGDPDLFVPSCWTADPPGFPDLMAGFARMRISEAELRNPETGFFCAPGERPVKTGTPWPLDRDPPWAEEGMKMEDWAAREDAKRRADGPFLDPAQ